jgi:hypothetical protein
LKKKSQPAKKELINMGCCEGKPEPYVHDINLKTTCCVCRSDSSQNIKTDMSSINTTASKLAVKRTVDAEDALRRDPMGIVEKRLDAGETSMDFDPPADAAEGAVAHSPPVRRKLDFGNSQALTVELPWEPTPEDREAAVTMACFGCTEILWELCDDCRTDPELLDVYSQQKGTKENPFDLSEEKCEI